MTTTRYIGLAIIGVCAVLFAVTFSFPTTPIGGSYYGPAFFPRLLALFIAVLALVLVVTGKDDIASERRSEEVGEGKAAADNDRKGASEGISAGRLVARILVLTLAYLVAMRPVGYFLSTVVYTFASVWMLRPKDHVHVAWVLLGSLAFAVALQYLFGTVMNVMLPPGLLYW
jgi:uncharacterized membrane protein